MQPPVQSRRRARRGSVAPQARTLGEIQSTLVPGASTPTLKAIYTDLPAGDAGVRKTIAVMQQYAAGTEGALHPQVYALARQITANVASRDYAGELSALFEWVRSAIKFRGEPDETLQTPLVTLQLQAGDCDDMSSLLGALLRSLGYQFRFRTVAADAAAPAEFSHVFVEAQDKASGNWVALDPTVSYSTLGWQPSGVTRSKAWGGLSGIGDPPSIPGVTTAPPNSAWQGTLQNILQTFSADIAPAVATRIAGPYSGGLTFSAPGINASAGFSWGTLAVFGLGGLVLFMAFSGGRR